MKILKRNYIDVNDFEIKVGNFINSGVWADGHLAYSRLDENNEIIPDEEGAYYQTRFGGKLCMERVQEEQNGKKSFDFSL